MSGRGCDREPKLAEATNAKYTKVPLFRGCLQMFPRALKAVAEVSRFGAQKHEKMLGVNTYLTVPDADTVYRDAEARHLVAEQLEGPYNEEDAMMLHKAQKAWNALADLEVYLFYRPQTLEASVGNAIERGAGNLIHCPS